MKRFLVGICFLVGLFFILNFDPRTKESNIDISSIEQKIEDIKDIDVEAIYQYINDEWFTITKSEDSEGYNISSNDSDDDIFASFVDIPQQTELTRIADTIFRNETTGNINNLVHWNTGEEFASMGIAHFLWYPEGKSQMYGEQFPQMIRYLHRNNVKLPNGLLKQIEKGSYWNSKSEWAADKGSKRFNELVEFLNSTRIQQAQFIQNKFFMDLLSLFTSSKRRDMKYMDSQIKKLSAVPGGWLALIDYANFKGMGGKGTKAYGGYDWGLRQVLMNMKKFKRDPVLTAFSKAAEKTLRTRVKMAPEYKKAQEKKWMEGGWKVRVRSYRNYN